MQNAQQIFAKRADEVAERIFVKQTVGEHFTTYLRTATARMEKILGIKDLVTLQRIQDKLYAQLVADNYARSIVLALDRANMQWNDDEAFDEYLTRQFGVRKIIVAAGKSTRISPTGLIHKQILRADGYNTNIKLARCAAAFGKKKDVVVIDHIVAYHILSERRINPDVRDIILNKIDREFDRIIDRGGLAISDFKNLAKNIRNIVADTLVYARHRSQQQDTAATIRSIKTLLQSVSNPPFAEYILDEIAYLIFKELIEIEDLSYIDQSELADLLGLNCIVAVAKPYGPGEAYLAGVERLQSLNLVDDTQYTIPVYSDYASAILDDYLNIYFHSYLQALSYFNLIGTEQYIVDELPVITIGGKSPLDAVRDKGNIILVDTKFGSLPYAIREWRDMTKEQQQDAETRLEASIQTGRDMHALNAGVFIINTGWARGHFDLLRRKFNHPDESKGKLYEYWYTDFVEIASNEDRLLRAQNPDVSPKSRIVFLGADAPWGNKDIPRTLKFRAAIHNMIRNRLLAMGIVVDEGARVTISSPDANLDLDRDLYAIFGNIVEGQEKSIDGIYIFGDVHIDISVRVENGTVLDGRGGNAVVLRGNTIVGSGVGLKGVTAKDTTFGRQSHIDGFNYQPPAYGDMATASIIQNCVFDRVKVGKCVRLSNVEAYSTVILTGVKLEHARLRFKRKTENGKIGGGME